MFSGFCPETIDFLWGIRLNNRRDWFLQHKQAYLDTLYEPMKALGSQIYGPLQAADPALELHVSRIYRDARYAHGLPYKDSLWLSVRHDRGYWAEHPCLYFEVRPESYGYGLAVPWPRAAAMEAFRQGAAERPDEFLALVAQTERDTGMTVSGDEYRRPKPCPDRRLERFFRLKNVLCCWEGPVDARLFQPSLADEVARAMTALLPLYEALLRWF